MLKVAWTERYILPLPPNHRFPMSKYELLPQQLLHEGTIRQENIFRPSLIVEEWILLAHDSQYWHRLSSLTLTPQEIRRTGFPLTRDLVDREMIIANGTLMATDFAMKYGIAMNIAGGTHHAFTYKGEGFCLLNDMAIAARYLLRHNQVKKF